METITKRNVLKVLPNGADVLAIYQDSFGGVVLATWRKEYITWVFGEQGLATTTNGNYFRWDYSSEEEEFERARADFIERVTRYSKFIKENA